ncbi:hypothetical protein ACFP76_17800 [Paracoccus aerius]|uniref:hypothetical protein n=1 Tax=Paracoccus aerius TaxID=1915382 RepID=UPI003606780E
MKTIIGFYYRQANEVRQGFDADEKHRAFLHIPGNKPILTWFRRRSSGRQACREEVSLGQADHLPPG